MEKIFAQKPWGAKSGALIARGISKIVPMSRKDTVTCLKSSDDWICVRISVSGRSFFAKAFNTSEHAAHAAFERELFCLQRLSRTGLAPELIFFSRTGTFCVTEYCNGTDLDLFDAASGSCREIGRWYARFDESMPRKTGTQTNWCTYLEKHGLLSGTSVPDTVRQELRHMPIAAVAMAKNDAHFSNFLRHPDGEMLGIDFEAARFKPVGWDILLTSRLLGLRFPHDIACALKGLMEGWGRGTDQLSREEFSRLATIFAELSLSCELRHRKRDSREHQGARGL